jgi:hypothetical protein
VPGDHRAFIGFLDVFDGSIRDRRFNLFANVRTAAMPDVATTELSPAARISDHILNLRWDDLRNGAGPTPDITGEVYRWLPDDFDFLAIVEQVETTQNRYYRGVRNTTPGTGAPLFDYGLQYGSPDRLQGMITFPISTLFDAGGTAMIHELGQRWMVWIGSYASGAHWNCPSRQGSTRVSRCRSFW